MTDFDAIAKAVNKKYISNKYLQKKFKLYNNYYILIKEIMTKCISKKKNASTSFFQYSNKVKNDCAIYKNDNDKLLSKYNLLLDECRSDLTMGKPILAQKLNKKFSLEFLETEKNDLINSLKNSIKLSKEYRLFREQKRDNYADYIKGNKEIENEVKERHQNMLYECKKSNSIINKIKKYELKKKLISNNIKILNEYIDIYTSKIQDLEITSRVGKKKDKIKSIYQSTLTNITKEKKYQDNNSDDDKRNKKAHKRKNEIIKDFTRVEELFDISQEEGESEEIIDEELHSDDDTYFESKIKPQNKLTVDNIKNLIPNLNLKQIEFNSKKREEEADLYSMERRKFVNKNVFDKIKEMKKKIEKLNLKLISLKLKENKMMEFIKKIKGNYKSIMPLVYQNSQSNIFQEDNIIKSLNAESKRERKVESVQDYQKFLDNISEIEEKSFDENEKSEDKKETKETRKGEEKIKKFSNKIFVSMNVNNIKPLINGNKRKKILISLNGNFLKKSIKDNYEKPKSK